MKIYLYNIDDADFYLVSGEDFQYHHVVQYRDDIPKLEKRSIKGHILRWCYADEQDLNSPGYNFDLELNDQFLKAFEIAKKYLNLM